MKEARRFGILIFFLGTLTCIFVAVASAKDADSTEFPYVPNPAWTNGELCDVKNPDFKELRYAEKIPYCERNVSTQTKFHIYKLYGVPEHCRSAYTIDHFVPLSLGGTNDIRNLWPEARAVKRVRQNLEVEVYKKLSTGKITQAQAVDMVIRAKWHPPVEQIDATQICLH